MGEEFSNFEKEQFEKAKKLSLQGDLAETLAVMKRLVTHNPDSAIFSAVLANTLWDMGDLAKAENEFRRAIELAPKSEKISLGLFHCLWEKDKKKKALEEKDRFTKSKSSEAYKEIMHSFGLNESVNQERQ